MVLASRLRPTSWSQAAAYQALSGKWRTAACATFCGCDMTSPCTFIPRRCAMHRRCRDVVVVRSGGNGVLVAGGRFAHAEVEEERNDHDSGGDEDAGGPAAGGVAEDAAHDGAEHGPDLGDQVEHAEGRSALRGGDHVARH